LGGKKTRLFIGVAKRPRGAACKKGEEADSQCQKKRKLVHPWGKVEKAEGKLVLTLSTRWGENQNQKGKPMSGKWGGQHEEKKPSRKER